MGNKQVALLAAAIALNNAPAAGRTSSRVIAYANKLSLYMNCRVRWDAFTKEEVDKALE